MGMSGGGGGGGSGKVDYPDYMKAWHAQALGIDTDGTGCLLTADLGEIINAKIGASPFATLVPFDPATRTALMDTAVGEFKTIVDDMTGEGEWPGLLAMAVSSVDSSLFTDVDVNAEIAAYNAIVDADIDNTILPRFRRGMQDINAVNTSAFVVGEALLEAEGERNKAKFAADAMLQNYKERMSIIISSVGEMVKLIISKLDIQRALTQAVLEENRLIMIAEKEETDQDIHLSELDGKWDLEVWGYAGNMLASIGSASVRTGQQTSPLLSALGMGLSGIGNIMTMGALI